MIKLLIALPIAIILNIILGAELSDRKQEFDKAVLISGIRKAVVVYVVIGGLVGLGHLLPELGVILDGTQHTIESALNVLLWAELTWYVAQVFTKLISLMQSKSKDTVVEPLEDAGNYLRDDDEVGIG